MVQLNRQYDRDQAYRESITIKVVGIGGAGSNILDRVMLDGINSAAMIAINTDVQALTASVATQKVQLGRNLTRGLGSGGDPDLGLARIYLYELNDVEKGEEALKHAEHLPLLQERFPAWAEKVEFWHVDDAPGVLSVIEDEVMYLATRLV